jgi:hypothetical protein
MQGDAGLKLISKGIDCTFLALLAVELSLNLVRDR